MAGREKPHMDKYKEITNGWNFDVSCTHTLCLVSDLESFKRLIFAAKSVQTFLLSEIQPGKGHLIIEDVL
jgi:hypothetical protein